ADQTRRHRPPRRVPRRAPGPGEPPPRPYTAAGQVPAAKPLQADARAGARDPFPLGGRRRHPGAARRGIRRASQAHAAHRPRARLEGGGMKLGSLFAGIGGFDLAAERVGMEVAWQSELDPHASRVLAHHWPDVPNLGDIHDITEPPAVDVLCGGFPCQDYSVAGRGAGLAGDRGALWWQMHRIIAECRPTWVVGENVHGLTTSRHQDSLRTIIGSLVDLGYGVVWRVLDAQWFGVAQRRRRVFIVGHSGGQPRPDVLALAQSVSGDSPPSQIRRAHV